MSFLNLLNQKIVISRMTVVSGDKTKYATLTSEYVNIQRMSEVKTVNIGGAIGKTFRLYLEDGADIQKGDMLKDEDGNEYRVIAVTVPAELGSFIHLEAIINLV